MNTHELSKKEPIARETKAWKPFGDVPFLSDWFDDFSLEKMPWVSRNMHPIKMEEFLDAGQMVVRVEIPGVDPDKDIELKVGDGYLMITGHRQEEIKSGKRSEFYYGDFSRTIPLPHGVTEDGIKAHYKDGILEVRIPQIEMQTDTKKIKVERLT